MKAFGENPIGNGPYKLAELAAQRPDRHRCPTTTTVRTRPKNAGFGFQCSTPSRHGYTDLQAGNLDLLDTIPPSALRTYKQDLGGRAINKPSAQNQTFTIPERLAALRRRGGHAPPSGDLDGDQPQADHPQHLQQDSRTRALDFTATTLPGFNGDLTGDSNLKYNPTKAVQLWNQAERDRAVDRHLRDRIQLRWRTPGMGRRHGQQHQATPSDRREGQAVPHLLADPHRRSTTKTIQTPVPRRLAG